MNGEKETKTPSIKGISYLEALSLILFTLKILGYTTCSWWIVFAPIILSWAVGLFGLLCLVLAFGIPTNKK